MVGQTVSHYRIVEKIGEGGMGEVYLAEDLKLRRQVAVKFLPERLTGDETRRKRFRREAQAAAAIEHPHVGAVHDVDEVDGKTFIVMEHVRGNSLRDVLRERPLSVRGSLDLAIEIADGLGSAHERGVIHRDVKPENIIITEDGYAKIIDFGLARILEPPMGADSVETEAETETHVRTREGLVMGTAAYMSPEQARGEAVHPRSDVFSLGLVLYEMLSGRPPFRRSSLAETLSAVLEHEPPPLTAESGEQGRDLQRVLRKALAKDANARYQSVRDLALDLRELRETTASGERPALSGRRGAWWPALVAGVAILAIAVGWYWHRRAASPPTGIGAAGRPAIAVMYFEDHTGTEETQWLARGLPHMLVTGLAQTPGLDVISSQRIEELLRDLGQESLETVDKAVVTDLARRAGAGAIATGSVFSSGAEFRLDVQVEDVESGRILTAESVRGDDVFPLIDELTGRIRTSLQVTDRPRGQPIVEVTTSSLDAYHAYIEALEARRHMRLHDARESLERAVAVDPAFALAHYELWTIAVLSAAPQLAEQSRQSVEAHIERLPPRQRALFQARLARPREAVGILAELIASYPDEEDAYSWLEGIYRARQESEAALAILERGVVALPHSGLLRNDYGYLLLREGRYAAALTQFGIYARTYPQEPNPHDCLGEAHLVMGQAVQARASYARALELDPQFSSAHRGRAFAFAMEGLFDRALVELEAYDAPITREDHRRTMSHGLRALVYSRQGRYREARESVGQGLRLAKDHGQNLLRVDLELLSSLLALQEGRLAKALSAAERAEASASEIPGSYPRSNRRVLSGLINGVIAARERNAGLAQVHLGELHTFTRAHKRARQFTIAALEGEIALAEGDLARARGAFDSAFPGPKMIFGMGRSLVSHLFNQLRLRDGPARVMKADGDRAGAIAAYRALNTPGLANPWTSMFEPRYVLETARLLEAKGDRLAARTEYLRFLDLWKNADSGLPEIEEARRFVDRDTP